MSREAKRDQIVENIGKLIIGHYGQAKLCAKFDVSIRIDDERDVFDAIVAAGKAPGRFEAIRLCAEHFKPVIGGQWRPTAEWLLDYQKNEKYFNRVLQPQGALAA